MRALHTMAARALASDLEMACGQRSDALISRRLALRERVEAERCGAQAQSSGEAS